MTAYIPKAAISHSFRQASDLMLYRTEVFKTAGAWQSIWHGRMAPRPFTNRGDAQAWLDKCERAGKYLYY